MSEVLVDVRATAIAAGELDWPQTWPAIPGHDVSGVVSGLGEGVTELGVGDAVFGLIGFDRPGAAAQHVVVPAADLVRRPPGLGDVSAAAVPLGCLTAWQALVEHGRLRAGQRCLVHGGAGGVGVYAVQLARHLGAEVIATASAADAGFVAELGAHRVIDYAGRFENALSDLDLVLDPIGGSVLSRSWQTLRPGGTLVAVADEPAADLAADYDVHGVYFVVSPNHEQLTELSELLASGRLRPVVGSVFGFDRVREAFAHQRDAHVRGKVLIDVAGGRPSA